MKIVHLDPAEAIQAFMDLNAKFMLPIHYNTFVLTDEPLDEPLQKTIRIFNQKEIGKDRLKNLKIGETVLLY